MLSAPGTWLDQGDISLGGHLFITDGYQPPSYTRATSFDDTADPRDDGSLRVRRVITDQGPTRGIWKQFTLQCHNGNMYDQTRIRERGRAQYDTLVALFQQLEPLRLVDFQSGDEYWVSFDQTGLSVEYHRKPNERDEHGTDLGPEYDVHVTLLETEVPGEE